MQISEFSKAAGLPPDTVRFYIKRGLLKPETGMRGGANPYQIFTREHVEAAKLIRLAQSLGFTLREIASIANELNAEGLTKKRRMAILAERLAALEEKAATITRMTTYLRAKIAWIEAGERGPEPLLDGAEEGESACGIEASYAAAIAARRPAKPRRARVS
jgi:MerR family copper efflux transcriptional regulator